MSATKQIYVEKADNTPLYQQVQNQIKTLILNGTWPPGKQMPGEAELASQFRVAVGTVRRALSALKEDGMLARRPKTGTFVTGRMPQHNLRQFFHYFRLQGTNGETVRSTCRVLDVRKQPATADQAASLQIKQGDPVVVIDRVRSVDGKAVMSETYFISASRVPDFPQAKDLVPLLYQFLWDRYDIRISAIRERVGADIVNDTDRELLDIGSVPAVLVIDDIGFDQAGVPAVISTHRCTTQDLCYINEIQ